MIVERGLRAGDRLPGERELMALFGASKGSVREALSALRSQGLIRTRTGPGGGIFLAEIDARRARALLSNYFLFRTPTIADIYDVRCELEPELAASLAGRLAPEDFARLERTLRIYDAPPRTAAEEYEQRLAELDFHTVLAELCPNPVLGFYCSFLQKASARALGLPAHLRCAAPRAARHRTRLPDPAHAGAEGGRRGRGARGSWPNIWTPRGNTWSGWRQPWRRGC